MIHNAYAATASNGTGSTWTNVSNAVGAPDGQSATISIAAGRTKYLNLTGLGVAMPGNGVVSQYGWNVWCSWSGNIDSGLFISYVSTFSGNVDSQSGTDIESSTLYKHQDTFAWPSTFQSQDATTISVVLGFTSEDVGTHTLAVDAVQSAITFQQVQVWGFRSRVRPFGRMR